MEEKYDFAVIGAGPGGYVAAIRAAQLNQKVVLIEQERIGGTCINRGCIPTKYLLQETKLFHDIQNFAFANSDQREFEYDWQKIQEEKINRVEKLIQGIEFLLQKNGVKCVEGHATLTREKHIEVQNQDQSLEIHSENIVLATGSKPASISFIQPDGKNILYSKDALGLNQVPESLLILGAGAIGLEIASIYQRLGCKVKVLEILPQILPGSDKTLAKRLERKLHSQGIDVHTKMQVEEINSGQHEVVAKGICLRDQKTFAYKAEKVLVAVGRRPVGEAFSMWPIPKDESGFVKVDDYLETEIAGIYAIGDLIGGKLLAHKASHEGIIAIENALGARKSHKDKAIPMAVFTNPEFAAVGQTEEEAREHFGDRLRLGLFSLQSNGRALTMGEQDGMVKIIADENEIILGAHILAPHASELIAEMTLAINKRMKLEDIAHSIHIHPTLSEAVMESALKARNQAIHALNI